MEWDILIPQQCQARKKEVKKKNMLTLCVRQGEMKSRSSLEAKIKSTEMYISLQTHYAPLVITECRVNQIRFLIHTNKSPE